jgi:hypothetical protein
MDKEQIEKVEKMLEEKLNNELWRSSNKRLDLYFCRL